MLLSCKIVIDQYWSVLLRNSFPVDSAEAIMQKTMCVIHKTCQVTNSKTTGIIMCCVDSAGIWLFKKEHDGIRKKLWSKYQRGGERQANIYRGVNKMASCADLELSLLITGWR